MSMSEATNSMPSNNENSYNKFEEKKVGEAVNRDVEKNYRTTSAIPKKSSLYE